MPTYRVMWEIDIETEFDSPREAADKALAIQRDPNSTATIFEVFDPETGDVTQYDLSEEEGD